MTPFARLVIIGKFPFPVSMAAFGADVHMGARTRTQRFSERTLRQVRLDCDRAVLRARYCPERSVVTEMQCIDDRPESEDSFGHQLWYFEGHGVDPLEHRQPLFGVVEYSIEFGLHELVEDGVFDSTHQRERFRELYEQEFRSPSWSQPAHRLLLFSAIVLALATLVIQLIRTLSV